MISVIRQKMMQQQRETQQQPQNSDDDDNSNEIKDITLSVLGNSLGGLYARYAIAKLAERCQTDSNNDNNNDNNNDATFILDNRYRIHFNIFCTTATPHLGVAGHTFLPLPRTAEIGVAHAMGNTGRDLFRVGGDDNGDGDDLMKTMATHPDFLEPLRQFQKRIAYANAYGIDFPVPTATAAFLSESSAYPHHFVEGRNDEEDRLVVDDNGLVIATLHTPPNHNHNHHECCPHINQDDTDDLALMSSSLDALGWKKVFVDVRKEIPKIAIPKSIIWRRRLFGSASSSSSSAQDEDDEDDDDELVFKDDLDAGSCTATAPEPIHVLKQRRVVGSKDVAAAVAAPSLMSHDKPHLYVPVGHNMIVAFSRSRFSTYLNKAGRPVVDALAKELVEDIFAFGGGRAGAATRMMTTAAPPMRTD